MRVLLATCILSLTVNVQNLKGFKKIDDDYNYYLKNNFKSSFIEKRQSEDKIHVNFIFGKLNKNDNLLKLTEQHSFSVSTLNKENKLLAAILYGIKHFATYEFIADDYEQSRTSKTIVMKEFLKLKIHTIPDTSTMKIVKQHKINRLETFTQFKHENLTFLKKPIIISFYSNHQEKFNGIKKSSKIIIKHYDKIIFSSIQNGHKNILKHNSKINRYIFVYKLQKQNKLITGGLMNHILKNILCKIRDDIHLNSIQISNVSDLYRKGIKDLKRIYNRGRLYLNKDYYVLQDY